MASWIFDTTLPTTTMNSTLIKTVMDRLYGVSGIPTASTASFTKVLPRILDFFLPGYGFICNSLIDTLGIDINFVLWIVVGFYTLTRLKKVFLIMMAPLMGQFIYKFTFDSDSRAYESFMSWANKHEIGLGQRNVQLEGFDSTWDVSNALKDFDPLSDKAIRTHPQRIKLMPSFGTHWFWYSEYEK